jgi:hypothetical protein
MSHYSGVLTFSTLLVATLFSLYATLALSSHSIQTVARAAKADTQKTDLRAAILTLKEARSELGHK